MEPLHTMTTQFKGRRTFYWLLLLLSLTQGNFELNATSLRYILYILLS